MTGLLICPSIEWVMLEGCLKPISVFERGNLCLQNFEISEISTWASGWLTEGCKGKGHFDGEPLLLEPVIWNQYLNYEPIITSLEFSGVTLYPRWSLADSCIEGSLWSVRSKSGNGLEFEHQTPSAPLTHT